MDISKTNAQAEVALQNTQKASETKTQQVVAQQKAQQEQRQEKQELDAQQLDSIAKKLNEQMERLGADLHFGYNDKINSLYLSVTEKSTGREIRRIPSEEAMRLTEHFRDVIGLIFDKKS
ncbi:FlaG family protein [Campylobacter sp.]|uniref:FlaG family protein n=1 Tax=Campylobacter sp. TaxID=205 RepID=UPI0026DD4B21|nr:FlaG family protein [Campylobacter sp.]MDO4673935.1 FlaG family protein [Campylobacter sp.]